MTGKERAEFRKQANSISAIFQIGKGEISDAMLDSIDEALEKRELIKISVLENAELSARDASEMIAAATGSEVIQCIGRKFVLYRKKQEQ
ncbi:MAG: YhbY family RNA-binding protein [Clostridia bacterium]|nr:YhbY family RNA-binding protein [Clostridia bacterium]